MPPTWVDAKPKASEEGLTEGHGHPQAEQLLQDALKAGRTKEEADNLYALFHRLLIQKEDEEIAKQEAQKKKEQPSASSLQAARQAFTATVGGTDRKAGPPVLVNGAAMYRQARPSHGPAFCN